MSRLSSTRVSLRHRQERLPLPEAKLTARLDERGNPVILVERDEALVETVADARGVEQRKRFVDVADELAVCERIGDEGDGKGVVASDPLAGLP